MPELLQVLLVALLPAAGNVAGGLFAETTKTTRESLSLALHAAAGIIIGVIAIELAPRVFERAPPWIAALAMLGGGVAYLLLDGLVEWLTGSEEKDGAIGNVRATTRTAGAWMIYAAVSVDLFSDGLLIGTGSSLSFELALILALDQVTTDVPEGFATVANFKEKGIPRRKRLLLSASFVFRIAAAALLSYFMLRGQSEVVQLAVLAFVAGLLLVPQRKRSLARRTRPPAIQRPRPCAP